MLLTEVIMWQWSATLALWGLYLFAKCLQRKNAMFSLANWTMLAIRFGSIVTGDLCLILLTM